MSVTPRIPATPKPGITKTSKAMSPSPSRKSRNAHSAPIFVSMCPPKKSPTHSKPRNPGIPKPGVRISIKIPRMPNERRSELISGFVRKKTILSASVASTSLIRAPDNVFRRLISETPKSCSRRAMPSSVRGSLVPSISTISYCPNSSVRVSACASANPYSNACWVDKVSSFPWAQRISISSPSSSRTAYSSGRSLII